MRRGERWQGWGTLPAALILLALFGGAVAEAIRSSLEGGGAAFGRILRSDELWPSLLLTWRVALTSTAVACVLGLGLALSLRRAATARGGGLARLLLQVPLPVPHLVIAIALLMLLSQAGLLNRLLVACGLGAPGAQVLPDLVNDRLGIGVVLAYVWKETPFVAVLVLSALRAETLRLEEAARNLGAPAWMVLRDVTLPAVLPALRTAGVLVFAYAFGAFEVPRLLGQTRPSMLGVWSFRLYTDTDLARRPDAMVVALLIFASVASAALFALGSAGWRRRPQ